LLFYYLLAAALLAAGWLMCRDWGLSPFKAKLMRGIFCLVAGFGLFAIAAVREGTGYDYNLYAQWYVDIHKTPYADLFEWDKEKGFTIPVKIIAGITRFWQPMFICIAFVVAAGIAVYIWKYSSAPHISFAAFVMTKHFAMSMNFMRQYIAAIICAYAVWCIYKKQPLRYVVLILFASAFHVSALLLLPFYFILRIRMNWIVLGLYGAVSVACYIFADRIIGFVTQYVYIGYTPDSVHITMGLPIWYTVFAGVLFLAVFLIRKRLIEKNRFNSVLIGLMFFSFFFELMGSRISVLSRFMILFEIAPVLILIPAAFTEYVSLITDFARRRKKTKPLDMPTAKPLETPAQDLTAKTPDTPPEQPLGKGKAFLLKYAVVMAFLLFGCGFHTVTMIYNGNGEIPYVTIYHGEDESSAPDEAETETVTAVTTAAQTASTTAPETSTAAEVTYPPETTTPPIPEDIEADEDLNVMAEIQYGSSFNSDTFDPDDSDPDDETQADGSETAIGTQTGDSASNTAPSGGNGEG
jgi:hypothetical protein